MTDNPTIELEENSAAVMIRFTDDGTTVEARTVTNVTDKNHPTALAAATLAYIVLHCEDLFWQGWEHLIADIKAKQEALKTKQGDTNDNASSDTRRTLQAEGEQPEAPVAK